MVSSFHATNRRRGGANQKGNRGSALRVRRALEEEARALAKEESRRPTGDATARGGTSIAVPTSTSAEPPSVVVRPHAPNSRRQRGIPSYVKSCVWTED